MQSMAQPLHSQIRSSGIFPALFPALFLSVYQNFSDAGYWYSKMWFQPSVVRYLYPVFFRNAIVSVTGSGSCKSS